MVSKISTSNGIIFRGIRTSILEIIYDILNFKQRYAQGWPGHIFSIYNVPSSKEQTMDTLFYLITLKWIKDLRIARKKKKDKKRTAYCEKRWEMKLRGLR